MALNEHIIHDGAVVVTPQHKVVVIDTGGLTSYDTGARILTPFLHSLGKSSVDIFIPSHVNAAFANLTGKEPNMLISMKNIA